jgi:hypothetical protein
MQANEESGPVPLEEIMQQLYDAARSDTWRPGPAPANQPIPMSLTSSSHTAKVQRSIDRASRKTYVRAAKPFRRLLRNQGAVNDSLLEAVAHLLTLTQELIDEISDLQRRVTMLEENTRNSPPPPSGREGTLPKSSAE